MWKQRVRSWGIRYQGTTNSLEFQNGAGYGIQEGQLVQAMPFIMEGAAIDWWNVTPCEIRTSAQLTELREYFLPPRYEEQLETRSSQLRQRETEERVQNETTKADTIFKVIATGGTRPHIQELQDQSSTRGCLGSHR